MSIDQSVIKLKEAFSDVATEIERELPEVWAEASRILKNDRRAVDFLLKKNVHLESKSPVDLARESEQGHKQVMTYLTQIKYGVYL